MLPKPRDLLKEADHRPHPLPHGPWLVRMTWHDLLLLHWRLSPGDLGLELPAGVEIDTRDGEAWLSLVAFHMSGVRVRGGLGMPGATKFPELNLRTYVQVGGVPAIWFLSLDAASRPMVEMLRRWFRLPYLMAEGEVATSQGHTLYDFRRTDSRAPPVAFRAEVTQGPVPEPAQPGSLQHFLSERYAFAVQDRKGRVRLGHIHHRPYPLQPAEPRILQNNLLSPWPTLHPDRPELVAFAKRLDVLAWTLRPPK